MSIEQKTEWKTPELIVLVRSKPEEAVLSFCKTDKISGAGTSYNKCHKKDPNKDKCGAPKCNQVANS